MTGRVTRKNNRRRNRDAIQVHEWLIMSPMQPGECQAVTHSKEFGRLTAEFQLFGPFDGVRTLPDCGCEFVAVPVVGL